MTKREKRGEKKSAYKISTFIPLRLLLVITPGVAPKC